MLSLSETLPLRTTRMLGNFATNAPLQHRYGDLTSAAFPLLRMTDSKFFAADHPMEITEVLADNQTTSGWARALETSPDGTTYTVVLLSAPAPDNTQMSARGRGKRNPDTGALIENPGDMTDDVARIAGRPERFPQIRAEAAAAGLVLAGSIGATADSIRATLDAIAQSAGAIWTKDGGRLYPTGTVEGPVIELTKLDAANLKVQALIDDTADILRLAYDVDEALNIPQRFMELTASPMRYGGIAKDLQLDMLRSPANAEAVGTRILSRMAGRRYRVTMDVGRTDIRPGAWIRLLAHPEWPTPDADPTMMVLGVDITPGTKSSSLQAECVLSLPQITVTAHSVSVPPTAGAAIDVSVTNGMATFTITDAGDRSAVAGARVALDGSAPRTTDSAGKVQFPATPGTHTLAVEAPGTVPFAISILL